MGRNGADGTDRQGIQDPRSTQRTFLPRLVQHVSDYHFDNWNDGGKVFTSYLAHPTQGAVAEAIFWQNNDHVRFSDQDFHSATYRNALLQAFAFATIELCLENGTP